MFETNNHSDSKNLTKNENSSKDYVRTTDQQKLQLIDLVINEKYSMKLASEIVGVKLSTVKYIVKAYKTDKEFFLQKLKPKKAQIEKERKVTHSKKQIVSFSNLVQKNQKVQEQVRSGCQSPKQTNEIYQVYPQYVNPQCSLWQNFPQLFLQWSNFQSNGTWFY